MKTLLSFLTVILFASSVYAATGGQLDGQKFAGTVKFQGTGKPDPDNFIFDKGTFRSTACDEFGYTSAPYSVKKTDAGNLFEAKTKNPKGATIAWTGMVAAGKISGTAVMTAPDGDKSNMVFEGQVAKK